MAGLGGFFAGGLADSMQQGNAQNSLAQYRQDEMKLQQQAQQNAQKRFEITQGDNHLKDAWGVLTDYVENAKIAGKDPSEIAKHSAAMLQGIEKYEVSSGRTQPGMVSARFATLLAGPPKTETTKAMAEAQNPMRGELQRAQIDQSKSTANVNQARAKYYESQGGLGGGPEATELQPVSENAQRLGFTTGVSTGAQRVASAVGMTPDQLDFAAVREAHGDTSQSQGFGGSRAGAAMRTIVKSRANQYWMDKGMMPQEANATVAEFQAMKRGAATLGQLDARMTAALAKAKATAPVLLDISSKVNRSQYPDIASIQLALQKRVGTKQEQENLARFNIAIETLASNYGSTLGMGNSVLSDFQTKRAQSLLEHAYSDGTLKGAVDQILTEIDREEAGTRGAMRTFFGGSPTTSAPAKPTTAPAAGAKDDPLGIR